MLGNEPVELLKRLKSCLSLELAVFRAEFTNLRLRGQTARFGRKKGPQALALCGCGGDPGLSPGAGEGVVSPMGGCEGPTLCALGL